MKYFLKKTNIKKGEYLQIYISEYSREKGSRNRCFKSIGYTEDLRKEGIKDPVKKAQNEVDTLNAKVKELELQEKVQKIGSISPMKNLGYFVLKGVTNSMPVFEKDVNLFSSQRQFQYNVFELMMALVYARAIAPSSKKKTYEDTFPLLFEKVKDISYQQVLSCCEYIGSEYKRIIAFLTKSVQQVHGLDFSKTYFDCTNFYFEIDKEDDFRKKGPCKNHTHNPLVGMGLLLDKNQIPINMTLYPGNESEKQYLRKNMSEIKKENNIEGRTIQIADKGLNCARNIHEAIKNNDGYIFSKSLKSLKDEELTWFYNLDKDKGWTTVNEKVNGKEVIKYKYYSFEDYFDYSCEDDLGLNIQFSVKEKRIITFNPKLQMKHKLEINRLVEKATRLNLSGAKKDEFGAAGKYIRVVISEEDKKKKKKATIELNDELIERDRKLAGFNMLVTSELNTNDRTIYAIYHNLWRIEQSFRMMKSFLNAHPIYVSGENSIKGHFLTCYIGVVLERLLEFNILGNSFNHEKIISFIRDFSVVRRNTKDYMNMLTSRDEVGTFLEKSFPQVTNAYLSPTNISALFKTAFKQRIESF